MTAGLTEAASAAGLAREAALRASLDPRRARLGVVHTPPALARWAMRRVDACLRHTLQLPGGLSSPQVGLLDVSVGSGVWLAAALEQTAGRGTAPAALLGFDVDSSALETARALLAVPAAARGWPLSLRSGNTLALEDPWPSTVGVRVVVGNPPWAARSGSRDVHPTAEWIEDFRRDATGQRLVERRLGVLSDDYVRFFRWAAEQARRSPAAVVCLVTNASFLDGPVHRGMRARLREWFDGIEVLDLGGNALVAGDGGVDANVFGVRLGVAVTVLWRDRRVAVAGTGTTATATTTAVGEVGYVRVRGTVGEKWAALGGGIDFVALPAGEPGAAFSPLAGGGALEWPAEALALDDAMPFHREGVQTNRDGFATAATREELLVRMRAFAQGGRGPEASGHFSPERARAVIAEALARDPGGESWLLRLAYRPFEVRYVVALSPVSHRPRPALLRAAGARVPCLLTARKDRGGRPWCLFGASLGPADGCFLSTRSSCRTRVFPAVDATGRPNLSRALLSGWLSGSGIEVTGVSGEALIEYALGLLGAASYRARFDGLLRRDYPRLLPPRGVADWQALRAAGRQMQGALYGPEPAPAAAASPATDGIGHFRASQLAGDPQAVASRLHGFGQAMASAEALVRQGACGPWALTIPWTP